MMAEFGNGGGERWRSSNLGPLPQAEFPLLAIHIVGRLGRLLSVYALHQYLVTANVSIAVVIFTCLLGSTFIFFAIQKPWNGRPLTRSQIVPTIVNGGVLALSLVLWGRGLRACGPVRTVLAEYVGAVLGGISALMFGRKAGHLWRKVGGLVAMLGAFYFLSQGWAMATFAPFSNGSGAEGKGSEKGHVGLGSMIVPILSGLLAALRRIIARRVSLKSRSKKRFHAITVAAAACCLFPFAMLSLAFGEGGDGKGEYHGWGLWPYLSTVLLGIVMVYYVDAFVEDKLQVLPSSPQHLVVTGVCLVVLELVYGLDFSLVGFLWCVSWLGSGIYAVTTVDASWRGDQGEGEFLKESRSELALSSLPS